jgi:uncharacterized membrane protein affecting hemolysin expression
MNILLIILLVLAVLIALLLLVAFFTKEEYSIEKEVTPARPRQEVFNYIRLLKNQDRYNKSVMMDPSASLLNLKAVLEK